MHLKTRLSIGVALLITLCNVTLGYADTLRTPTGLNYIDKERAFAGRDLTPMGPIGVQ